MNENIEEEYFREKKLLYARLAQTSVDYCKAAGPVV